MTLAEKLLLKPLNKAVNYNQNFRAEIDIKVPVAALQALYWSFLEL